MCEEAMASTLRSRFSPHSIGILGYGMEGRSTFRFLRSLLPDALLHVADRDAARLTELSSQESAGLVALHAGESYAEALSACSLVFKTPGIPWRDIDHIFAPERITSQIDLFLSLLGDRTIGVTGTKGKSTTTALLREALRACGRDAVMVGNIGLPALDVVLSDVPERVYVLELSSHMLETVRHAPCGAVFLNLFEDHLDHYRSFEAYAAAKENLLRLLGPDSFAIIGDQVIERVWHLVAGRVWHLGAGSRYRIELEEDGTLTLPADLPSMSAMMRDASSLSGRKASGGMLPFAESVRIPEAAFSSRLLRGMHNLSNMRTALLAAWVFEERSGRALDVQKAVDALNAFPGLPHRLEFIGEASGIRFFDDSISTIPQASISAVKSIGDVDTLIFGGLDRGIDYGPLENFLAEGGVPHAVALPASGHALLERLEAAGRISRGVACHPAADMADAVEIAFRVTRPGRSCVLSPAAASYGYYRNFEERGAHFAGLVRAHPTGIVLP